MGNDIEKLQAHFHAAERRHGFEMYGIAKLFDEQPAVLKDAGAGKVGISWSRRRFGTLKESLGVSQGRPIIVMERLSASGDAELMIVPLDLFTKPKT